jgi:ribosomal protein S18 acetylase RimI-like enzyme
VRIRYNFGVDNPEIKPLTAFNTERFNQIASGYTSDRVYRVVKRESPDDSAISFTWENLPEPYIKTWDHDPEMVERYTRFVRRGFSRGLYLDDALVGIAIAENRTWNRELWIWEFHIDAAFQGQGYGHILMNAMAEVGKQAGCRALVCECQNTNAPAINFYRQAGFEIGAVDLSHYTNRDVTDFEVAIFMKHYLEP